MNGNLPSNEDRDFTDKVALLFQDIDIPPRPEFKPSQCDVNYEQVVHNSNRARRARTTARRLTQFAASFAAMAGLVVIVLLISDASGYAQIAERIRRTETVKFKFDFAFEGMQKLNGKGTAKNPDLIRLDIQTDDELQTNIYNFAKGTLHSFGPNATQVSVFPVGENAGLDIVRSLGKKEFITRKLPAKENQIADTGLFEFKYPIGVIGKVWVHEDSQLPSRIEVVLSEPYLVGELVYSDFEWDADLDDSVFELPELPVVERGNLLAEPTTDELIAAIKIRNAFTNAPFESGDLQGKPGLSIGQLAYDSKLDRQANYQRQIEQLKNDFEVIGLSGLDVRNPVAVQERIDFLCMKLDQWSEIIERTGGFSKRVVEQGEAAPLAWWINGTGGYSILAGDLEITDAKRAPTE